MAAQPHGPSTSEFMPPEAWPPLVRLARAARRPVDRFLEIEASGGVVLLVAAALALVWANSPISDSYFRLWHTTVSFGLGALTFERSLHWVVNDGLMVIFFFVVGMEIRREIHDGALADFRRAALPVAAALGGMLVPAAIYLAVAGGGAGRAGWGVPMATDIAFAVGILALLGRRVSPALRVLLLAVAVIDDLGAIVVIALFYSSGVAASGLGIAALGVAGIIGLQRIGVRSPAAYVAPALVVWGGVYSAGIHPTIAGVIVGMLTPVRAWFGPDRFAKFAREQVSRLADGDSTHVDSHGVSATLRDLDVARREALSPATNLIDALHRWVAFVIMPVFALANAGVALPSGGLAAEASTVVVGVAVALVAGKPLGVLLASVAAMRLGLCTLPDGVTLRHLVVLGFVAGIGFTMSLFIAPLAFTDERLLAAAKQGVLVASAVAAALGLMLGRILLRAPDSEAATSPRSQPATA